jgi:hypothetical protein
MSPRFPEILREFSKYVPSAPGFPDIFSEFTKIIYCWYARVIFCEIKAVATRIKLKHIIYVEPDTKF